MTTYYINHIGYVSQVEEVEADSPEAALDASQGAIVQLCNYCNREWDSAGDTEIGSISDENGETVWEAEPPRPPLPTRDQIIAALAGAEGRTLTDKSPGYLQQIEETFGFRADAVMELLNGGKS